MWVRISLFTISCFINFEKKKKSKIVKIKISVIPYNFFLLKKFINLKINRKNKFIFKTNIFINIFLIFKNNFNNILTTQFRKNIFFKMNGILNSLLGKKKCFKKKLYFTKYMYYGLLFFFQKFRVNLILSFININNTFQDFLTKYLPDRCKIFLKNKLFFFKKKKTFLKRYVKKKISKL